jgi:hypothetical protein
MKIPLISPYPWYVPDDGTVGTICDKNGMCIGQAQQTKPIRRQEDHAQRIANGRMMAAAPEVVEWSLKMMAWLEKVAAQSDYQERVNRGRFDSLADASKADYANYMAMWRDGKKALSTVRPFTKVKC